MITAKPKFRTVKVWAGIYGGHYDVIMFFSKRPRKSSIRELEKMYHLVPGHHPTGYYDILVNEKLTIGSMCLQDFMHLYDVDLSAYLDGDRPKDTEIVEVFQLKMKGPFIGKELPHFHVDD